MASPGHPVHQDAIAIEEDERDDQEQRVPVELQGGVRGPSEAAHEVAGPDWNQHHHSYTNHLLHLLSMFISIVCSGRQVHEKIQPDALKQCCVHLDRNESRPKPPQVLLHLVHLRLAGSPVVIHHLPPRILNICFQCSQSCLQFLSQPSSPSFPFSVTTTLHATSLSLLPNPTPWPTLCQMPSVGAPHPLQLQPPFPSASASVDIVLLRAKWGPAWQ